MSEIYSQNLKALAEINPYLANKIDQLNDGADDFTVLSTKNNSDYTLKVSVQDKEQLVHSLYRPRSQAKRQIEKLDLGYYNLIGVAGIGCGHYIREILRCFNHESQLIIIENRLDMLKEVMKQQDLTDILIPRNVMIFDGTSQEYTHRMQQVMRRIDYNALVAGNVDFFKTPILKEIERDKYNKIQKEFFKTIHFLAKTLGNDPGDTLIGVDQIFTNMKHILNSINLGKIDAYQNKPAVCVAAGPSLDKNIDVLKEYQDEVLIITADTVLGKLLNKGIIPDIVGVVERTKEVYNYFFRDLIAEDRIPQEVTLVTGGVAYPELYNNFPGRKITVFRNNIYTEEWFADNIEGVTGFDIGNSVANLNFSIAQVLGCEPIILIGQDLAFSSDGLAHTGDTRYDEFEGKLTVDDVSARDDLVEVKGYNGERLVARKWWKIFKDWFEYKIAETGIDCIDATEGGAYIEGTEVKTLQETAEQYFTQKVTPFHQLVNSFQMKEVDSKADEFKEKVLEKLSKLEEIRERIIEVIDLLEKTKQEFEESDDAITYAQKKYGEINTEVAMISQMDMFFLFTCQAIFVQLERYKVALGDLSIDTEEKFDKWSSYELDKLRDIKRICNLTLKLFRVGVENIEGYIGEE
ncbi:hypothetical protein Halha_2268 [Halobacteroides halobius DSM 5150]|uniref:6-hydroxymethylpterin diphosphokinase MptE-like domain-containing protein n=1 Tax=Halobacteroides halobius (strain ATCC 35273 / DSM 5150 / MD-1) TaxID=748449 RepID=L0KA02_HALHC|nr:6-hydroxymethylpterin diphosphokinase MptE-like protein [Halobacteroides halobius]AGB42142.1 hypothetical protein Halha_2268 [Halobacteroides halobius DSM 5150]